MSEKAPALLIEDDVELLPVLQALTAQLGFTLEHQADGQAGLEAALSKDYSFVICDLNLPVLHGLEVCKRLRDAKKQVPVLMLTSEADELNKVLLLECGADDYIVKPFSGPELKARIKAVLRRTESAPTSSGSFDSIEIGELRIDKSRRLVWMAEEEVHLTFLEFEILATLASRPGHVFSRAQLLEAINSFGGEDYERGLAVHMTRIRSKLSEGKNPRYILTARGVGYRLVAPSELQDEK